MSPQDLQSIISTLNTIAPFINAMMIGVFSFVLFVFLVSAAYKNNISHLYQNEDTGHFSHTKFWTNIAYFAATVAFISINLVTYKENAHNIELVWLIFLSVVAGNNIANKFISYKYGNKSVGESQAEIKKT